jgi:starch synthase
LGFGNHYIILMKILFVASEAAPFAKAGGLGDVMYSLPLALRKLGHDARIMIPCYAGIDSSHYNLKTEIAGLKVPTDQPGEYSYLVCNIKSFSGDGAVPAYFLENLEYYEKRANVYGYADDHVRWALLCRGAIEFVIKNDSWKPDVIVASDWQTGLVPDYLKTTYRKNPILSKIPVVFAIHNLSFQGMCDFRFIQESERDSGREPVPDFFNSRLAQLNWMLRGIIYSDSIATVSPTYASEILTPEYGEGLEKILFENQNKIHGILNGIDYQKCDPETCPHLPVRYDASAISKKKENKKHLQKRLGLPQDENMFVAGIVSRLTEQKGFDLLEPIINPLFENLPLQLVVIGDGEPRYKEMIQKAKEKFPEKVGYFFNFDLTLPYLVFAGSDAALIPSKFEPCGIVQMEAMRFGCIPVVRKTGGLADTVRDFHRGEKEWNGFVFERYDPWSLLTAIIRARVVFDFEDVWKKLVKKAMKEDFSWSKSAKEYLAVFNQLLREKKQ